MSETGWNDIAQSSQQNFEREGKDTESSSRTAVVVGWKRRQNEMTASERNGAADKEREIQRLGEVALEYLSEESIGGRCTLSDELEILDPLLAALEDLLELAADSRDRKPDPGILFDLALASQRLLKACENVDI